MSFCVWGLKFFLSFSFIYTVWWYNDLRSFLFNLHFNTPPLPSLTLLKRNIEHGIIHLSCWTFDNAASFACLHVWATLSQYLLFHCILHDIEAWHRPLQNSRRHPSSWDTQPPFKETTLSWYHCEFLSWKQIILTIFWCVSNNGEISLNHIFTVQLIILWNNYW